MEKYVTQEEFEKLAKGKKVKDMPNPLIKYIGEDMYEIMKPEAMCKVSTMPHDHYTWFIGCTFDKYQELIKKHFGEENSEIVVISTDTKAGYYWFPTELVCGTVPVHIGAGIIRNKFTMKSELAQKTGFWDLRNPNAGSFECYFRSAKVNEAIRILNANHWNCPEYVG